MSVKEPKGLVFATKNGGGFLTERFPDAYKVIWDFSGDVATSRHIPEVSYVGIHHPGLMGTAPSAELLAKWTAREKALIATDPMRVPPLALPPLPDSAILGSLSGAEFNRVAGEAARTAPPRENGGNQDIKNLTAGSRIFYPVFVWHVVRRPSLLPGRRGDHLLWAIEMGGFWTCMSTSSRRHDQVRHRNAMFMPGRDPQYSEWLAFSGCCGSKQRTWILASLPERLQPRDRLPHDTPISRLTILGTAPEKSPRVVDIRIPVTIYIPRAIRLRHQAVGGGPSTSRARPASAAFIEAPSTTSRSLSRRSATGLELFMIGS
jgi:formamidase